MKYSIIPITRTPNNSNSRYLELKLNPLALILLHNLPRITRTFVNSNHFHRSLGGSSYREYTVVASRKIALKQIAKPNFKRAKIFSEDLVGIHMTKPVLVLNRPIQFGFAILDLSKYLMYDFHYYTWMRKFDTFVY